MNTNPVTLSFPKDLEKDFFEEYFIKSLRHVRLALLLAIFFYSIFGILDAILVPEVKGKIWLIRYGVFFPCIFFVFLFSFSHHFKRYMQASLAMVVVLGLMVVRPAFP